MQDEAARLAAVASAAGATAGAGHGLERLTRIASRVASTPFAFVSLLADEVELLTAPAGPAAHRLPRRLPAQESVCPHLVRRGAPLLVPDLRADPAYGDLAAVHALGLRSYAGAPVRDRAGAVLGGLCVADTAPRAWTCEDADLLTELAGAASDELAALVALQELERARDDERRRAEEQAALHRIAAAVVRGEVPHRVLQHAADELVRLLGATAALVLRFRPDGGTSVVVSAGPVQATSDAWSWYGRLAAEVRRTGATVQHDADLPCAAVPLEAGGRTWGALAIVLGPDGLSGRLHELERLADLVALVLVNAEAQLQLTRLARTDPLTGAPNRRVFEERLAQELTRCRRAGGEVLVAVLDVDLFKQVNDRFGHETGDAVLTGLAERVGELLRAGDLLARLGGDEWGLLLPSPGVDPAAVLDRLRAAVAAEPLAGVPVTVTMGAVVAGAACGSREVLRRADEALYAAKRSGRDRVALGERLG